jgi:hypothetical protein
MSLIDSLKSDPLLQPHIVPKCEENGLCVEFDPSIGADEFLIIKVDAFYNACLDYFDKDTTKWTTPASIDCLIVVQCKEQNSYRILLVEQKNTPSNPPKQNMRDKFETTLLDFMSNRFRNYNLDIQLFLQIGARSKELAFVPISKSYTLALGPMSFANKRYAFQLLPEVIHPC